MSSATRPKLRPAGRLVAAIVLTMTIAACSDPGPTIHGVTKVDASFREDRVKVSSADIAPFQIATQDVAGVGTPLGGGLKVPESALLLGAAFPDLDNGGFQAQLLITGDPVEVFNELGGQAKQLGMSTASGCLSDAVTLGCAGIFADASDGESLTVNIARFDDANGLISGAGLRYRPPGANLIDAPDDQATPPSTPLAVPPLPASIPAPDPADLGRGLREATAAPNSLERGSVIVGLPGPCACDGKGWSVVIRFTGVPRDVIAAYGRQFAAFGAVPNTKSHHVSDLTLLDLVVGQAPRQAEVRALLPDNGSGYAILTVQHP